MGRENMSFEDQWSEAFDGAEVTPPAHVWSSIDGALANKEASGYKKRIIFFKWMAAASVALALAFGLALLNKGAQETNVIAESVDQNEVKRSEKSKSEAPFDNEIKSSAGEQSIAGIDKKENITDERKTITSLKQGDNSITLLDNSDENNLEALSKDRVEDELPPNTTQAIIGPVVGSEKETNQPIETIEAISPKPAVALHTDELQYLKPKSLQNESYMEPWEVDFLYRVPDLTAGKEQLAYQGFDLWAGISFGSGSFNPGSEGTETPNINSTFEGALLVQDVSSLNSSNAVSYASGNSFSAGMNLGGKVSRKILIGSGLHYHTVSPGSSSSIIITDNQSNQSFALTNDVVETERLNAGLASGSLMASQGVTYFSNTLQYLTIPLKAGYVVLDRKLNLTVNSGMATNILIGSSLNNADGGLQQFGGATSSSSAFNKTYFDLLTSIELNYKLMDKYHLSLEPNYRRALNSFTSEENVLTGNPTNFGVSLGIKYEF